MLCQNGLQQDDRTFRLLPFTYGAFENAVFVRLGYNLLPWQCYCQEVFATYLVILQK